CNIYLYLHIVLKKKSPPYTNFPCNIYLYLHIDLKKKSPLSHETYRQTKPKQKHLYISKYFNMCNMEKNISKSDMTISKEITETDSKREIIVAKDFPIMQCINCPSVLECPYTRERLKALESEAKDISEDIYREEIELDDSADNSLRAQYKRDNVYKEYIKHNAPLVIANETCIYEKKEITTVLKKFVGAGYDLLDPRVHMIITELIGQLQISMRANKAFTTMGILLAKETPAGVIYYSNPLLKDKAIYSKLIIEATESLDRILKSDEKESLENDFTKHLLKTLQNKNKINNTINIVPQ
nr:hypothetical protein [Bacilli bacterium]